MALQGSHSALQSKPILGFGKVGWIASAILLVMLGLLVSGVDFQFHYIRLIDRAFGNEFLFAYYVRVHVWHGLLLLEPTFGLIDACLAVISLFIIPRSMRWWRYAIVIGWGLVRPMLAPYDYRYLSDVFAFFTGWMLSGNWAWVFGWFVMNLITCGLLWIVTRSRQTFAACFGASILASGYMAWRCVYVAPPAPGTMPTPTLLDVAIGPTWKLAVAASLFWWAIRERISQPVEGRCSNCGYDLRGGVQDRCPECGYAIASKAHNPQNTAKIAPVAGS
jgi:predicted RNA-binding Zn-ribbon protein involved in translation (DUF1610 family)